MDERRIRVDEHARPVPGLRGTEHVGFTVPDLEEAIKFFVEVLGCEYFYDLGPFRDDDGTWFADNLDTHPRAWIPRAALLRCGHGSNFEIFEFEAPDQTRSMPRMSDWGAVHLAFYVDDMDAALADLERRGIRILGGAKDGAGVEAGDGSKFAHFLSPWGMILEFVSFPNGKDYMAGRDRVLWHPLNPSA
ncbi:VOC family protein [Amycolatopsis sp. RM579]|uniref:VOC family protein n=2 Tax=Amycolatopsis pithecellobii TaxID=664692 RepID=A0A6N7YZF6_9PSEU|nr:VOC family protein [Amycolatopsis pithecellobii]